MRPTIYIVSLWLFTFWLIGLPALAQYNLPGITASNRFPATKLMLIVPKAKQKTDSLQRVTQPGYYSASFTQRKRSAPSAIAKLADNSCYSYLCGLTNGEIVTTKLGQWNDPAIWSVSRIPTSADIVRIRHQVIVPASYNAQARLVRYDVGGKLLPATGSKLRLGQ